MLVVERSHEKKGKENMDNGRWGVYQLINNNLVTLKNIGGPEKGSLLVYLLLVYLVTALISSLTVCLANSPGNRR